jgi:hypothetical protein
MLPCSLVSGSLIAAAIKFRYATNLKQQGPVVQKPVNFNPGLALTLG